MLQPLQTYNFNNAIIIIPARMGSTRLYGKPLLKIAGKPMIWHVWSRAIKSNLAPVYVATDTKEIAEIIESDGGKAVLTSNAHFSGSDRVYEAIEKIDPKKNYDLIINLQGDVPNFDSKKLINLAENIKDYDICTFVTLAKQNEINLNSVVKTVISWDDNKEVTGKALYFSRNKIPFGSKKFWHHVGVYAWKRTSLKKFVELPPSNLEKQENLEQLRALEFGMNIKVVKISKAPLSIDTQKDYLVAKAQMEKKSAF